MLRFNFEKISKARGIESISRFLTDCGFSSATRTKIKFGKAKTMNLGQLEVICKKMNCTPNDILEWVPQAADTNLPAEHLLRGLVHRNDAKELLEMVHKLSYDKIIELSGMVKEMVNAAHATKG